MRREDSDNRSQHSRSSDPPFLLGTAFGSLQAPAPSNLVVLRKLTANLMACDASQAAERIIEEYRFLIGKAKSLSEQFSAFHDKRRAQYMEIKEGSEYATQLYKDLQTLYEQSILKWFESEKEKGFEIESKTRGVPLLQEFKKLESQFNCNLKKFKNLYPSSLIENLRKENAEMKKMLQDPKFVDSAANAINKEMNLLKEKFESQLRKSFQNKQTAENQYDNFSMKLKQLFSKMNEQQIIPKEYLDSFNLKYSALKTGLQITQKQVKIESARYDELLKTYSEQLLVLTNEIEEQAIQQPQEVKNAIKSDQCRIKHNN